MVTIEEIKFKSTGRTFSVEMGDYWGESPRDGEENLGKLFIKGGRTLPNINEVSGLFNEEDGDFQKIYPDTEFNNQNADHIEAAMTVDGEFQGVFMEVYAYIHSGIALSCSPFSCGWDSGKAGFIIATKSDIENLLGEYNEASIKKAKEILSSEIQTYDYYLNNEIYHFAISDLNQENIDSCGGFYPDDQRSWKRSGILDHVDLFPEEVLELLEKYPDLKSEYEGRKYTVNGVEGI